MACNDMKCFDRDNPFPAQCTNGGCSCSAHKNAYPLHELISKVVVTENCSSGMLKQIEHWRLRPSTFKVTSWQKAAA